MQHQQQARSLAIMFRRSFLGAVLWLVLLPTRSCSFASSSLSLIHSLESKGKSTTTIMASSSDTTIPQPPIARRDEDSVVWAGVAPPGWNAEIPRQSETSKEALLDPPIPIPDPYGWLRDESRANKIVIAHLDAENSYTNILTRHFQDTLVPILYEEMVGAIQETDYTVPRPQEDYVYYTRTFRGQSYVRHCRAPRNAALQWKKNPMTDEERAVQPVLEGEQILLDVNQLAQGKSYCGMGAVKASPSHRLLAYTADFSGNEVCQMFIKDLETANIVHQDPELEISGSLVWGSDDSTIFFLKQDAAQRPYQVYRRSFLTNGSHQDELLFEERNDLFWLGIYKSLDGRYLFVEASSKETSEIHFLDLMDPAAALQCVAQRREKVTYEVEHRNNMWWIASNVGGLPNLALFTAPAIPDCQDQWRLVQSSSGVVFDGNPFLCLDDVTCFQDHVVASGRTGGLPAIWILGDITQSEGGEVTVGRVEQLSFPEKAHDCGLIRHYEFDTDAVAVHYSSLVTPAQSIDVSLTDTSSRTILKERNVPGYDKEKYGCERTTVLSRDGKTEIPVSILYRRDLMEQHQTDGKPVPVHLYGYGSYGSCLEADFVANRLPLLNRGMVYVLAHVRGGGECGRTWYEEPNGAKYLCKKNTFNDFCDIAEWLINERKLTTGDKMSCEGRSAGGMLIGSSINQAPHLFRVAVLGVPFVDVVPTMVDASIPLTAIEWEEWGNPNEVKFHKYMMEYNPITNVQKGAVYPACLLTGGFHDPRVQYWEPAKFAAEIRHSSASERPVCLKIDMAAGHFSASDRYKYLKEKAFDYAFILDQLGLAT